MSDSSNKEKFIAQAQKLVEKGQFDKAIREYLKAVAEDGSDIRTWIRIGDLYVKLGQKNEATENYKKVAQLYLAQGETEKAAAVYRQIQAISPQLGDPYVALGGLYRDLGRTSLAVQQYEQAAELYGRQGKTRDALLSEQALVDLAPDVVARRIRLAEMYSKANLVPDAVREFSIAAMQLRQAGRQDEFVKVGERLLFHAPDHVETLKELARHYLKYGDGVRALTRLQAGFSQRAKDPEILELLAEAFIALGKADKAVAVLRELARVQIERGASAFHTYQRILRYAPDDAEARAALTQAQAQAQAQPPRQGDSGSGTLRAMIFNSASSPGAVPMSGGTPLSPSLVSNRLVTPAAGSRVSTQFTPASGTAMASGVPVEDEAANIVAETESFLRFGLQKRALEHLQGALSRNPDLRPVRERLVKLHESMREYKSAISELRVLLTKCSDVQEEVRYLREILRLDDRDQAAQRRLTVITGTHRIDLTALDEPDEPEISVGDGDIDEGRRGFLAADRDTSEVPLADYREISDSKRSDPGPEAAWMANDAASTSEVPVADLKHIVDRSRDAARSDDGHRPVQGRAGGGRSKDAPSIPNGVPMEMGIQPTRPNTAQVEAVAEQMALTSGTLKDELAEVDFFLQQKMFDDARQKLQKLAARYPHSKTVQSRQLQLREMEGGASDEVVIDVDMADVREEVILSPSAQSLPTEFAASATSALSPAVPPSRMSTPAHPVAQVPIVPPVATPTSDPLRRTIPPPLGASRPSSASMDPLRRTLPPEFAGAGATPPPSATSSVRASQRSLPPPPPRPSRIMKAIQLPPQENELQPASKEPTPSESSGAFRLGISLRNRGQYEQAIGEFEKCLNDERRGARASLMMGLCHRDQNRVKDAIEAFKLGIHMPGVGEGDLAEIYYQLGRSYELLNDAREAIHFYQSALRREGRFRDAADRVAQLQKNLVGK